MSLNSHGHHLERAEVDQVLDVPLQDGATFARGKVVEADDGHFVIELETLFPGRKVRYAQGTLGVVLVSDG